MSGWQNAPTSPTTSDSFLYDGAGQRVEQAVTINGSITTTTTYVAGGLEEISANGTSTTLTKYFAAAGLPTAERVGTTGPLSYLATDGQGTVSAALDSAGNVTSSQLYTPYGTARYSNGSSPTSFGYTGQRADSATGLDYYAARYFDPTAGQFISADTANDGLNRYSYVHGNPATATDPSGHRTDCHVIESCGPGDPNIQIGGGGGESFDGPDACNQHTCHVSQPAPTCDALCTYNYDKSISDYQQRLNALDKAQGDAQNNAKIEASLFHWLAGLYTVVGAIAGIILASVAALTGNGLLWLSVGVLVYTITMLVAAANSIAAIFDEEKDWKKDMFTKDNVLLEKGKLETIRQVYGGTTMGTGLLETIIAFIPKVAALVTLPVAVITGAGLAVAFYGTMAMVSAAEIDLDNQAATLHM